MERQSGARGDRSTIPTVTCESASDTAAPTRQSSPPLPPRVCSVDGGVTRVAAAGGNVFAASANTSSTTAAATTATGCDVERRSFVLAPSRLSAARAAPPPASTAGRIVLRPSALSATAASSESAGGGAAESCQTNGASVTTATAAGGNGTAVTFSLQPPKFKNPFSTASSVSVAGEETKPEDGGVAAEAGDQTVPERPGTSASTSVDVVVAGSGTDSGSVINHSKSGSDNGGDATPTHTNVDGFVFGENLRDRVTNTAATDTDNNPNNNNNNNNNNNHSNNNNDDDEVEQPEQQQKQGEEETADDEGATPSAQLSDTAGSLMESAAKCERQRSCHKRHYERVEAVTGEEHETNVLQVGCKLYAFDGAACRWQERGRGLLRLNDRQPAGQHEHVQSRLVFRVQGSLRLALNAKLWPGMDVQRQSSRDVRVTAMDNDQAVRVFVVKCASARDATLLYDTLHWRLQSLADHTTTAADTRQDKTPPPTTPTEDGSEVSDAATSPSSAPDSPRKRHKTNTCTQAAE